MSLSLFLFFSPKPPLPRACMCVGGGGRTCAHAHMYLGGSDGSLPAMQESQVQSLDWKDFLEEKMATHYNILAWEIQWTEKPGRLYSPMESHMVRYD